MPIIHGIVIASEHEALILEVREIDPSLIPWFTDSHWCYVG